MSYAPSTLLTLRTYLATKTGLSAVSLGIVGNTAHTKGYHLGKDRIYDGSGPGIGDNDYSVKTSRDRAGLTNAASAMDIGNFARLRQFSIWLVDYARHNKPGSSDIREIIYSPDGISVLRWDRERGISSGPRAGEADNSHRFHTHISWYRDSESRSKTAPFRAFFDPPKVITGYLIEIPSGVMVRTYNSSGTFLGLITGLSVHTDPRVKKFDVWNYRIDAGKYIGRYVRVQQGMVFKTEYS